MMAEGNDIIPARSTQEIDVVAPQQREPDGSSTLGAALATRWRTLVVVLVLSGASSVTAVWMLAKPAYRVTSKIEIKMVVRPIMSRDMDTDISRNYPTYVATQRGIITSRDLISEALEAADVQPLLGMLGAGDPVSKVLSMLKVQQAGRTMLMKLALTGQEPEALATMLNSIVRTYLRRTEDEKRQLDELALSSLRVEQREIENKLKLKADHLHQLVAESPMMSLDGTKNAVDPVLSSYRSMLVNAQRQLAVASVQLKAITETMKREGAADMPLPGLQAYTSADKEMHDLKAQRRALELSSISDEAKGRGPNHPDVRSRPQVVAALTKEIESRTKELRQEYISSQINRLELQISDARTSRDVAEQELAATSKDRIGAARQEFLLRDIQHERAQLENRLSLVGRHIWTVEVEQNRMARISLRTSARAPSEPNVDTRPKLTGIALGASLMLALGISFLKHKLDSSFRTPMEVSGRLGVRVLGTVHHISQSRGSGVTVDQGIREPVRNISTALLASSRNGNGRTPCRLVTSPTSGSGKSSLALGLARSLAATGRRVLLVDGDNRRRGISERLEMKDRPGLTEILSGKGKSKSSIHRTPTPCLDFIPAGRPDANFGELLTDRNGQERFKDLFHDYDEVIVDSPPVLANSHAVVLATLVEEVVLVLRAGQSSRAEAEAARQYLSTVGATVVGAILNDCHPRHSGVGYGYSYGYGYREEYQESTA